MGSFQLDITIDRPPDDVFAVIADPTTMPLWYEAVERVTKTSAGQAVTGATYEITRSLPGGEAHNTVEITEHEAHHRVTLESRDGPTPFRYRYTLEPRLGEATSITLDGRISGAGLPGPIGHLDPLATQLFKHGMRRNLAELKRVIESTTASGAPTFTSKRALRSEPLARNPATPAAIAIRAAACTPQRSLPPRTTRAPGMRVGPPPSQRRVPRILSVR